MAEEINVFIYLPEKIFTLSKIDFNLESFGIGFGLGLGDITTLVLVRFRTR